MKTAVRRKALSFTLIYIILITICNLITFSLTGDAYTGLRVIGHFCVIELLTFLIFNSIVIGRFLNYSMIFVLVLFIFNFGQLVIYNYFQTIYAHVRFLLLLPVQDALYGYKYINLAFTMITLGILVASLRSITATAHEKDCIINKKYDFERVAKDIIMVTFPVKLVVDLLTLAVSIARGGVVARLWLNSFPNIFIYYGKISLIGFALLIILFRERPIKQTGVFLFIEIYILVMMVSGIRSENVGYVLVFLFLYLANRRDRIRLITMMSYGILGFFGLTFIIAVGKFRGATSRTFSSLVDLFVDSMTKNNVILSLLDTCGDTGYTAQCVLSKWLPAYGPSYGDAYYLGWMSIIPNIPGIFTLPGRITANSYFATKLQATGSLSSSYLNIGGSLIGEQFFNFGLVGGAIACFIIGVGIGLISHKSAYYMTNRNYYGMIKYLPMMFAATYWVRNYFGGGFREVVWGPAVCYIVIMFSKRYKQPDIKKANGSRK